MNSRNTVDFLLIFILYEIKDTKPAKNKIIMDQDNNNIEEMVQVNLDELKKKFAKKRT